MRRRRYAPELVIDPESTAELLVQFIGHEVRRCGFDGVVLGLSGGVDSAVVAALAVRALGPARVFALWLPYRASAADSRRDAVGVAKLLKLKVETVDITPVADAYFGRSRVDRIRRGNVLARLRMMVLFDQAKKKHALVAGTSNKTEIFLGYSTWYGDSAASFQPIGDLYKSQVWQLAEWLDLPEALIAKPPTADLWPGQTDEGELGLTYDLADRALYALLDRGLLPAELVTEGFAKAQVERLVRMIRATQFKRQMPTVAKLSTRTMGTDFLLSRDFDPESGL